MIVLVTGGAGFIGSHTCLELMEHGHQVVVVDDHSNSSPLALSRVQYLAGGRLAAYQIDLRDRAALDKVFYAHSIDAVIHFAAKKSVAESTQIPLEYFDINVGGTASLLRAMRDHDVRRLVFSSSCSIYGDSGQIPLTEDKPARPTNPYARSKWICEQMLAEMCTYHPEFTVLALRYFNPAGAHPSGKLGEDPRGVPNNLMPYLAQVAVGRRPHLSIFGSDYPTSDGTAVRDYVHVLDIAAGHRLALEYLEAEQGMTMFNLGTGAGVSVLEIVDAFSAACGGRIPYRMVDRRPGDVACLVADAQRAERALGWRPTRGLADMCADAWRFQRLNPNGYETAVRGPTFAGRDLPRP